MFTTFPWVYASLFACFKQLPVNFTFILLPTQLIDRERLVVGGSIFSLDSPLDCHDKIDNILVINLNIYSTAKLFNSFSTSKSFVLFE